MKKLFTYILAAAVLVTLLCAPALALGQEMRGSGTRWNPWVAESTMGFETTEFKAYVEDGTLFLSYPDDMVMYNVRRYPWQNYDVYSKITAIRFDRNVESIEGMSGLMSCSKTKDIYIPATVRSIDLSAFEAMMSLEKIHFSGSKEQWESATARSAGHSALPKGVEIVFGINPESEDFVDGWDVGETSGDRVVAYVKDDTLVIEGVGRMRDFAMAEELGEVAPWRNELGVTHIVIGDGVQRIGNTAFFLVGTNVTDVKIGGSVTEIGKDAFANCWSLTSVDIPASVTKIDENAFDGCSKLEAVSFTQNTQEIGSYAFNATALKTVNYSGRKSYWNTTSIGDGNEAFTTAELKCSYDVSPARNVSLGGAPNPNADADIAPTEKTVDTPLIVVSVIAAVSLLFAVVMGVKAKKHG